MNLMYTVWPSSLDPFYIVTYYIKWVNFLDIQYLTKSRIQPPERLKVGIGSLPDWQQDPDPYNFPR